MAVGIAVNGLYDDYGWPAAGACAAAAASTALLVRLRRLPSRALLVRLLHRVFMSVTFAALAAGAFGWVSNPRPVLLVAVGAVVVVLVTTPGVRMLRTLFRVAMIGIAVGYLSALLPEWDRSAVMKALIIGVLVMLANVYLIGSERGLEAATELFATPRPPPNLTGDHGVRICRYVSAVTASACHRW
ncbi:hypothetical protein ACQP1P_16835 [Dactylosporangium sp. CA-052675]|uniref:hypothetical protein n=1 Tax=Dactylosporangium sp. CA-052675 TaxID=3239927 RepID=UPI003D921635